MVTFVTNRHFFLLMPLICYVIPSASEGSLYLIVELPQKDRKINPFLKRFLI